MMSTSNSPQPFTNSHSALTDMPDSSHSKKAVTIAISLLKHKNPQTIQTLKEFLTFIPNPNHIKHVLTIAVIDLIYTSPESAFWLFQHPQVLEPEIQVRKIVAEVLTTKLLGWGYTLDDFCFTSDQHLETNETIKNTLLSHDLFCHPLTSADEAPLTLIRFLLRE